MEVYWFGKAWTRHLCTAAALLIKIMKPVYPPKCSILLLISFLFIMHGKIRLVTVGFRGLAEKEQNERAIVR